MNRSKGFTLIELIVVIGIIGILTAAVIFLINPLKQIQKGRDTTRKANLNDIRTALEIYRQAEGRYPPSPLVCNTSLTASGITYMNRIPCDPGGSSYVYTVDSQGVVYSIYACLENTSDPQISPPGERVGLCNTAIVMRNP